MFEHRVTLAKFQSQLESHAVLFVAEEVTSVLQMLSSEEFCTVQKTSTLNGFLTPSTV